MSALGVLLLSVTFTTGVWATTQLPDTSGIQGELTASLGVDKFFSLWLVFNNDDVKMSAEPFTIFAPRNGDASTLQGEALLAHPDLVKKLLYDHMVLGLKLNLDLSAGFNFATLGGRTVHVRRVNGTLTANGARVLNPRVEVPGGILVVLDGYLFPDALNMTAAKPEMGARPQSLVKIDAGVDDAVVVKTEPGHDHNSTFLENVSQVLGFLKSGVRVFQHFLSRSNVSHLLKSDEEYTVFVPTDHAFQRWHPIDWGFYPFSVPEFTESVMINHFVKGNLRQEAIKDGQRATTLDGREVQFARRHVTGVSQGGHPMTEILTVNGATIVNGDTPVSRGNIMFIGEVLFVTDSVVQQLHQENRDKETPPLLAFPWFGSQFLSHAFLALERQQRFTHITRFLNLADLAPHIPGAGYTFFVPTDDAFKRLGLDTKPDNYLSMGEGLQILLNHFVRGRLYNRDLTDGKDVPTVGNKVIHVKRQGDNFTLNGANVVESEVFVYNLGTMFFIDEVLFTNKDNLPASTDAPSTDMTSPVTTQLPSGVEKIPSELAEESGTFPDVLLEDSDVTASQTTTTEEMNELRDEAAKEVEDIETEASVTQKSTSTGNNNNTTAASVVTTSHSPGEDLP